MRRNKSSNMLSRYGFILSVGFLILYFVVIQPRDTPTTIPTQGFEDQGVYHVITQKNETLIKVRFMHNNNNKFVNYAEAMKLLVDENGSFRSQLTQIITSTKFPAIFWECAPVAPSDASRIYFEFVVINSPELAQIKHGNSQSFQSFLKECSNEKQVTTFSNLGKDANLVIPCPSKSKDFKHLAAFLREAQSNQIHHFWRLVGEVGLDKIKNDANNVPFWLSTSGLAVYWLHVRFDSIPKYYNYIPFTTYV